MPVAEFPEVDVQLQGRLQQLCGPAWVSSRTCDRLAYARDMWPRCLIRQRAGFLDHPPDLVVWPATAEQVGQVVRLAAEAQVPLIPFGAGSGVCGATLPHRGGIVCDLKRLERLRRVDEVSGIAEVEVGLVGEVLERELNRRGLSCGHFPSSIICSTVGGWVATRGAGQCSSRYGKIEDLVQGLEYVDHQGRLRRTRPSALEEGWSAEQLLVGSEGTAGIITAVELAVHRLPESRWLRGFRFPGVEAGLRAMRLIMRSGWRPAVLRLYDEFDTIIAGSGRSDEGPESLIRTLGSRLAGPARGLLRLGLPRLLASPRWLNRLTGLAPLGCLLVVVVEGERQTVERAAGDISATCRSCQGVDLDEGPARHWWQNRYAISYQQAPLFSAGAFVDTMEVATTWERLPGLYRAVRRALESLVFVMAHFSHAYREGCSVYFTFAGSAPGDDRAAARYDAAWDAAQEAVLEHGGVVSHHHGVGLLKSRFLKRQLGLAAPVLQVVKDACDPTGIFNPGKLGLAAPSAPPDVPTQPAVPAIQGCLDELHRTLGSRLHRPAAASASWAHPPVAVARPASAEELALVMQSCQRHRLPVVSAGRGTRLVGYPAGRWPGDYLLVRLEQLSGVTAVEPDSLWLAAGAATPLAELNSACRHHGLRPVGIPDGPGTLGGWLANNAVVLDGVTGLPASPVLGLEAVLPDGRQVRTVPVPRAACGPELGALWLGSGGCLGVITAAVLRLEPLPEKTWRRGFAGDDAMIGLELAARLARGPLPPRVLAGRLQAGGSRAGWWLAIDLEGERRPVEAAAAWCLAEAAAAGARPLPDDEAKALLAGLPGRRFRRWGEIGRWLRENPGTGLEFHGGWHAGCQVSEPSGHPGDDDLEVLAAVRRRLDPWGLCNPQSWPPAGGGT